MALFNLLEKMSITYWKSDMYPAFPFFWEHGPLAVQLNPLQDMKLWCKRIPA